MLLGFTVPLIRERPAPGSKLLAIVPASFSSGKATALPEASSLTWPIRGARSAMSALRGNSPISCLPTASFPA